MRERTEGRVLDLAALLCDELISDEQFAELDEILASDSEARNAYRGFLALHQRLQCEALEAEPAAATSGDISADPEPVADGVFRAVGRAPVLEVLDGRVRRAERRTMWSMAACVVVTLLVIVLLFRPRVEPSAAPRGTEANVVSLAEKIRASERAREGAVAERERGVLKPLMRAKESGQLRAVPPPPPPPPAAGGEGASVGPVADVGEIEAGNGGFLIREAAVNDIFQMLAKRAGKQYFHNSKVAGPEFTVSGHLNGGEPLEQMEELALGHGLTLYEKGNTVYALNKEQLSQLPTEELHHSLQSLRPDNIDQLKALIQPMLSPTGIANYEPKTNSLIIIDSAHHVDRARDLLAAVDKPKSQLGPEKGEKNTERARNGDRPALPSIAAVKGDALESLQSKSGVRHGRLRIRRKDGEGSKRKQGEAVANIETEGQINPVGGSESARPLDLRSGDEDDLVVALDRIKSTERELEETNRDLAELQFRVDSQSDSFRPMSSDKLGRRELHPLLPPKARGDAPAAASRPSLRKPADRASWEGVSIAGGVFANRAQTESQTARDRIARRKGATLGGASSVGGVGPDLISADLPSRESIEAEVEVERGRPASVRGRGYGIIRRKEGGSSRPGPDDSLASAEIPFEGQINHAGLPGPAHVPDLDRTLKDIRPTDGASQVRPLALRSGVDDELLADAGQASGQGQAQATISLIDRVPVITTTIKEAEVSNQVTEEVRYMIDAKDPVGDPATTREIGVTLGVTATPLPDGSIRMKVRPRSAQIVGEIIGQSGNKYPRVSESMRESIARVPEGHSVVLGGFYGQVKTKDGNKVPMLGGVPELGFFFKDKEAAKEPPSLIFVATPKSFNDQVVLETKILSVNSSLGGQAGVDWTSSLGEAGVPLESIGSLNSLFGLERAVEGASDGPIVLSPAQTKGVLRALSSGGLVTQTSNPTLIAEVEEPETTAQVRPERRPLPEVEKSATAEPYSTFSLHVSDVSFKLAKAALARGEWPAADQIRVEEFVNAFDYGDPAPNQREKVACNLEQAAHPFLQQRNLLRVSMRTAALGRSAETPLRLTVLLDKSGSMERMDRVDSVRNAFRLLADQLNPQDQVTLIGFARTPRLLVDRLAGNRVEELIRVLDSTPVEGGTNLEQALELGIAKAKEQMLEGAQNRIILLTDGAANLGNAAPEDLAKLVERMRQQGIAFDACGVGADGLNDGVLESLTRKGDGRYYFLDRPEDADEGFARQIAGALRPAARNVKVQMIFNPDRVGRYKLYGFEKHRLKKEDFRNDSVDAAELAAEEAGNAIYQVEVLPEGSGEIGTVSVRFQDTETGQMIERKWTIPYEAQVPRLEDSDASLRLASSAALLGERLKGSLIGESVELARLGKLMTSLNSDFPSNQRVKELVQMANKARELGGE